jgi:hypothetical protein
MRAQLVIGLLRRGESSLHNTFIAGCRTVNIDRLMTPNCTGVTTRLLQVKELVGSPPDGVLVNGDSGNDIELFQVQENFDKRDNL